MEQWPKSGTPDRPIAVIGYPLNTRPHNDSGRHLIGQNHTAPERSRMSIVCTRLWLNKSSKCTRLAYKPPDYGRTTRQPTHTHTRTRSRRELAPRHEAGHCLFFRALFPELFLWLVRPRSAHASAPNHSHSSSDVRQRPPATAEYTQNYNTTQHVCARIYMRLHT